MINVIGAKFQKDVNIHYLDAEGIEVKCGDWCVVEIDRGIDLAKIVGQIKLIPKSKDKHIPKIQRLATPQDWEKVEENKKREKEAGRFCQQKIKDHNLPMKLVTVHYTLEGEKIVFYFTSEERVDFRGLVKELVSHFKTRIELRQIGVRDEAKLYGSCCGWCGRELCCNSFLKSFESVQIKMAKEQNLILTPGKISGVCGRLMCCLAYEYETYAKFRKKVPKCGTKVTTKKGVGTIKELNALKEQVIVKFEDNRWLPFSAEEITRV